MLWNIYETSYKQLFLNFLFKVIKKNKYGKQNTIPHGEKKIILLQSTDTGDSLHYIVFKCGSKFHLCLLYLAGEHHPEEKCYCVLRTRLYRGVRNKV